MVKGGTFIIEKQSTNRMLNYWMSTLSPIKKLCNGCVAKYLNVLNPAMNYGICVPKT